MARLRNTVIPLNDYPTGTFTSPAYVVPAGTWRIGLEIARCTTADPTIWPNEATTILVHWEGSRDNGQTWEGMGGFGGKGGMVTKLNGTEAQFTWALGFLPPGVNRFRATVTIENGPLRTYANVIVDDEPHPLQV